MNNESLGMITQFQHLYFEDRMAGTTANGGYLIPDMQSIADAYGFRYKQMDESKLTSDGLNDDGFCLIDYHIDGLTTVSPKLEYNKPIDRPIPLLPEEEYNRIKNSYNA